MRNVKIIALELVAISLLVVPLAWSQGGNPPASTKESGQTSGYGQTAVEQTAQQAPTKRTELLTNDLAGIAGKRATVYRRELAPGASTAKHRHPVDTFVYVLDGTLTLEQEGQGSRTLNAGEIVQEVPGGIYNGKNTGTRPVTILVFSLGEKDQPFSVPVK